LIACLGKEGGIQDDWKTNCLAYRGLCLSDWRLLGDLQDKESSRFPVSGVGKRGWKSQLAKKPEFNSLGVELLLDEGYGNRLSSNSDISSLGSLFQTVVTDVRELKRF
jgi:hypothetical protein